MRIISTTALLALALAYHISMSKAIAIDSHSQ